MTTFLRLAADGGGHIEDWGPMPSADLIAGTGQQYGRLWLDEAETGLMAGVWACSPMTGRMGSWSTNEVMIVLEGRVVIDHADGSALPVGAGECFFIPKGTVCSWRQEEPLKKLFVIHSDASGLAAPEPSALKARKIDPTMPLVAAAGPDPALLRSTPPACHAAVAFADLTGQLEAGVWSASPYQRAATPFPHHELMHILDGEVTLTDASGQSEMFKAGDTVLVPRGACVGWTSRVPVRKIFCSFTPR